MNVKHAAAMLSYQEFEAFWQAYPRRVGKLAAAREWKLRRPDLAAVLAAIERQRPGWTDPKFIPHPRTWLHQGRWLDEEPKPALGQRQMYDQPEDVEDWWTVCQREHGGRCNGRRAHEIQTEIDSFKTGPV